MISQGSVLTIQYLNNGKLRASGGSEKVIKFWDSINFQQIGEIRDISGKPKFLVFTLDEKILFVSGNGNKIESLLINDLKKIMKTNHTINKQHRVMLMQLSSNQKELVVLYEDDLIQFWEVNLIRTNFNEKDGFILKNSESEIKMVKCWSANTDRKVTLWNVKQQKVLAVIELDFLIHQLAINQTSEYLVCVPSGYNNFNVWKIENIIQPYLIRNSSKLQIKSILLTKDDQQSVCNLGDAILIQNICNQEKFYKITYSQCIDFLRDQNLIATGQEEQIVLLSSFKSSQIGTIENHSFLKELLFICNGKKLLSGDKQQDIKLWLIEKCQLIAVFSNFYSQHITISSDFYKIVISTIGKYRVIISLSQNQSKSFNHRGNGERISILQNQQVIVVQNRNVQQVIGLQNNEQIEFENSPNNFQQCGFSPKSSLFTSYSENSKIQIWNYEVMKFNQKHEDKYDCKISCMRFSFDDKYLALTSKTEKLIKIWDFSQNQMYFLQESINETEEEYNDYTIYTEIYFSYDSLQVAFYNNDEIKIWKFISDSNATIFKDNNHSRIRTIASSPKQNLFATSSEELNIKFWHFETKQLLLSFSTGEQTKSLCFTYDGKYLISARIIFKLQDIQNFPQIKLCAASDSYNNEDILRIGCLRQTQGIWFSSSQNSGLILFDEFEYLGVLESSNQMRIQCQFSADGQFLLVEQIKKQQFGIYITIMKFNSVDHYLINKQNQKKIIFIILLSIKLFKFQKNIKII